MPIRSIPSLCCLAAAVLVAPVLASAEGNGFKVGEGRLHPYLTLESRMDSKAAVVGLPGGGFELDGDVLMHIKPGLKLEVPNPMFAVAMRGDLNYVLYTGVVHPGTRTASHPQGNTYLSLAVNRGGQVSFEVGDLVNRSDRVTVPSIAVGVLSLYNDARAQVNVTPSGGALEISPNYHLTSEFFQPAFGGVWMKNNCPEQQLCDPNAARQLDYLNHTLGVSSRWRFLPKTAFLLDANYGMRTYFDKGANHPMDLLKVSAGLAGLVTARITTALRFGWAQDVTRGQVSQPVGQAEIGYLPLQSATIKTGYVRNVEPVSGRSFSTYSDDRVYLDGKLFLLGKRLTLRVRGDLDFIGYSGASIRKDTRVTTDLGADYEFAQWLNLGGGWMMSTLASSTAAVLGLNRFNRQEGYARIQVIY